MKPGDLIRVGTKTNGLISISLRHAKTDPVGYVTPIGNGEIAEVVYVEGSTMWIWFPARNKWAYTNTGLDYNNWFELVSK